jgi:hypothetical protein
LPGRIARPESFLVVRHNFGVCWVMPNVSRVKLELPTPREGPGPAYPKFED